MSDSKISNTDQWLSKILPPSVDELSDRPDLLSAIEPVHPGESGAMEEVRYDIPAFSGDDSAADSLERSAKKFGTHVRVTKAKRKVKTGKLEDKVTRANRSLHAHIRKLVEQKRIKVPSYCGIHLSEYILRNRHKLPYLKEEGIKTVKDDISKRAFSTHKCKSINSARDKTVTSIISVPLFYLLNMKGQGKLLEMSLVHELIHCRDLHPSSKMTRLIKALGIDPEKDFKMHIAMLEYPAYLKTVELLSKVKANLTYAKMLNVTQGVLAYIAAHLVMTISMMTEHKQELARTFFKSRISRASNNAKARLRRQLVEGYYLNDRSLTLIGL